MPYLHRIIFRTRPAVFFIPILLALVAISGCAEIREDLGLKQPEPVIQTAGELAVLGMESFNVGKYHSAITNFEEITERYPFDPIAHLARLKTADCHYYMEEYPEAKMFYQEFKERAPRNEAIPYVMFQIGMCDLKMTDRIDRNVNGAKDAIQSFSLLLNAFENSPYHREAKARTRAAKEFLVNHEFFIAIFYVRTEKYGAATHRLNYLIKNYPDAQITPRAKTLLKRIEAGNPPKMGVNSWLPDFNMPDYKLFSFD